MPFGALGIYVVVVVFDKLIIFFGNCSLKCTTMKKYFTLLILFPALISLDNTTFAQEADLDLSDFIYPDLKRHQLDFDFDLGTSFYKNVNKSSLNSEDEKFKVFTTGFGIRPNYRLFLNNRKYQGTQHVFSDFKTNHSRSKNNTPQESKDRSSNYDYDLNFRSSNRFYLQPKFFIGFNPALTYNGLDRLTRSEIFDDNMNKLSTTRWDNMDRIFYVSLPVSVGVGRIEYVGDTRHALFIIEEIKKQGRLKRELSGDEFRQLSNLVSEVKNERVLDSRMKRIYEISTIDSFLKSNDLITNSDAAYFTSLYDMWAFGNSFRQSGARLEVGSISRYRRKFEGAEMEINYVDTTADIETSLKDFQNVYSIGADMQFSYDKPINISWQSSLNVYVSYQKDYNFDRTDDGNQMETESEYTADMVIAQLGYNIGYYPTTRTSVLFRTYGRYSHRFGNEDDDDPQIIKYKYSDLTITPTISVRYFFSPNFQVDFSTRYQQSFASRDFDYHPDSGIEDYELNFSRAIFSADVTLTYSIF